MKVTILLLIVICELCLAIRVPPTWDESASEVKQEIESINDEPFSVESFKPENVNSNTQVIPVEYFEYTAKKPQFAVDIASFHGVQSPENHYKAYPIEPYTGKAKPQLGKHHILDKENTVYKPFQEYATLNEENIPVVPVSSNYEVFHPYQAETPALIEIYKDPVLQKIRNDLENNKNVLQKYEKDASEPNISSDEYLESPKKTDSKIFPHKNVPVPFEIHRPQRRPIYYRPGPRYSNREHYLNHKLRHPWNQPLAKIRPMHYRPLKNHIHHLRQHHAFKYDDERNEYPQVQVLEAYSDPKDGYDIYERGKNKYEQLRNNVDESINKAVLQNRPTTYEKLEIQNNGSQNGDEEEEEDEFVPIKNYAQVRKIETIKHLPKSAALSDAETLEEIRNAPRLREAVKSTKAQIVYSEEGYEDTAYDHAGEQKHASENEGHGGYLKQQELSAGKYKIPSVSISHDDGKGSAYRDHLIHAEKWNNDNIDDNEETEDEKYSENEQEHALAASDYKNSSGEDNSHRNKRENEHNNKTNSNTKQIIDNNLPSQKNYSQKLNFHVPEIDINSTFLTEKEILNLAQIEMIPSQDNIKLKYPYYFKNLNDLNKNSPLRYAENLKFIPKKSDGGTEFYDSRLNFECPDVDDVPDPTPEKLKMTDHSDDNVQNDDDSSSKGEENFEIVKKQPRLKDLGNKIDCFKAKYFGENPLDSPFFNEEIISNPEPPSIPSIKTFKINSPLSKIAKYSTSQVFNVSEHSNDKNYLDMFNILSTPHNISQKQHEKLFKLSEPLVPSAFGSEEVKVTNITSPTQRILNYYDTFNNIVKNGTANIINEQRNITKPLVNKTYNFYHNKEDITKLPFILRKKRSAPFVYEPYKIIKDSQVLDSKKTTSTSNISPLIKQLQTSRIVEKVSKQNQGTEQSEIQIKRNDSNTRVYKDIGKKDREPIKSKNSKGLEETTFVDVNTDKRRGEPRYEIRHPNHKIKYTPVNKRKYISLEDYKAETSTINDSDVKIDEQIKNKQNIEKHFDRTNPAKIHQNVAASNTVRKTIIATTSNPHTRISKHSDQSSGNSNNSRDENYYGEYDDNDEEYTEHLDSTSTTSTVKTISRRRIRSTTTTTEKNVQDTVRPKLELVTRFRNYNQDITKTKEFQKPQMNEKIVLHHDNYDNDEGEMIPKFREKKKKSTKSTLVTDTKRYGNGEDDMKKEEVDALIGIKQDMEEYIPLYEKEENSSNSEQSKNGNHDNDSDDEKDEEPVNNDHNYDDDDDDGFDADNDDDYDEEEEEEDDNLETAVLTTEPTKRTLVVTTEAPIPTFATRNSKLQQRPVVTRKKIEIHKELPVNKSSPHVSQYKQDIKEVEVIKEIPIKPKQNQQKNLETLELYKDDNLAKDVNKLGGVEIFKEDIDLNNGPKHGGNYRSAVEEPKDMIKTIDTDKVSKEDAETSQSEYKKLIELDDSQPKNKMHGGNLKSLSDFPRRRKNGRNSKTSELTNTLSTLVTRGGNLRHHDRTKGEDSQRLVELVDDHDHDQKDDHDDDDSSNDSKEYTSKRFKPMHGGNYRSAKLTAEDASPKVLANTSRGNSRDRNGAAILNSFAQAVPILTTTPVYILDPSKRMYYYVDA